MHEIERQRLILKAVDAQPVVTVQELVELTGVSEATVRRDIAALHVGGHLRRVRGGAEALHPPQFGRLTGRPFRVSETLNVEKKRAIARAAVGLCQDGDSIIINGGTTTYQMVHHLTDRRLQVLTNSFAIAEHLGRHSRSTVLVPSGALYEEHSLILSPFDNDGSQHFFARRMFMGAQGVAAIGVMESDPLIIQSEQRLIRQAEDLVLLVDSSKFARRSSLIICALDRVSAVITDTGIDAGAREMLAAAGVELIVAEEEPENAQSVA